MSESGISLAVVGYRNYTDYENFCKIIDSTLLEWNSPKITCIISGGASGVDCLAEKFAKERHISLTIFPADWKKYGKRAGPRRNTEIIEACTHLIAMPSKKSIGTLDSIRKAKKESKVVHVKYID